jgi:ferric-dicitrate binding protein FerR (iron transport regulator)
VFASIVLGPVLLAHLFAVPEARGQQNGWIGSLSAVGGVRLRGVPVFRDGTLFAGDRVETAGESYARILLREGTELELGSDTGVRLGGEGAGVRMSLEAGRMAFSSPLNSVPVSVSVETFRIEAPGGAAGEIAFLAPNRLRVVALQDTLTVTRQEGEPPESVPEGEQRIINLDADVEPVDLPPAEQAATTAASGSSSAKWILVGAGAGGGVGALVFLAGRDKDSASPSQP